LHLNVETTAVAPTQPFLNLELLVKAGLQFKGQPSHSSAATASSWALLIGSQHQFCKGTWRSSSGRSTCSRPINTLIAISHNVAWLTNTSAV